jgi:hypothetical protein
MRRRLSSGMAYQSEACALSKSYEPPLACIFTLK